MLRNSTKVPIKYNSIDFDERQIANQITSGVVGGEQKLKTGN